MKRVIDPVMKELRETLLLMGSRAEAILEKAVRSISSRDPELADQVAPDDVEIDRLDVAVDDKVLQALALQAPVASDLREVVGIKMIAADLERVGDLARNMAKSAKRLAREPATPLPDRLLQLARAAQAMLRSALNAFAETDAQAARAVLDADDEIDAVQDEVIREELAELVATPSLASVAVDIILVAKNLERVGDHATNIAEDVILIAEARNVKHAGKL
ncbi:MAG: phosphate signaling complex protein PhoU [Myxococcota bacterium]|nr:phosphate signaling complex protein PhoU [Myxococcota bacterium]